MAVGKCSVTAARTSNELGRLVSIFISGCLFLISESLCCSIANYLNLELACLNAETAELKGENTAASLYWSKVFLLDLSFEVRVYITKYFQIMLPSIFIV